MRLSVKATLMLIIASMCLIVPVSTSSSAWSPVKEEIRLELKELRTELEGDQHKIANWLDENITGKADGDVQYAQYPEETYERKTGDCEDYSILAKYLLEEKYDEVHLVYWYGRHTEDSKYYEKRKGMTGHVIAAVKTRKGWGFIDINRFFGYQESLEDVVRLDCKLRKIKVKHAFIVRFNHYSYKKLKRII